VTQEKNFWKAVIHTALIYLLLIAFAVGIYLLAH
jgi:hypothetical protein